MEPADSNDWRDANPSCQKTLARKEFFALVIRKAAAAGALAGAPALVDKYLVPSAFAAGPSSCSVRDTAAGDTLGSADQMGSGGEDAVSGNAGNVETGCNGGGNHCTGTICGG